MNFFQQPSGTVSMILYCPCVWCLEVREAISTTVQLLVHLRFKSQPSSVVYLQSFSCSHSLRTENVRNSCHDLEVPFLLCNGDWRSRSEFTLLLQFTLGATAHHSLTIATVVMPL
jgi:hypothetical protein